MENVTTTSRAVAGDFDARVHETHTGVVILLGDQAYKVKKPIATDFLDFTAVASREAVCQREVALNRRLAPESYLGVGHFSGPDGAVSEPVVVMRRYADSVCLAAMVRDGRPVDDHLRAIAAKVAGFHRAAARDAAISEQATAQVLSSRWEENLAELARYANVSAEAVAELRRLADQFILGREALFQRRIDEGHIVDGHGDLLADDIFFTPDGPELLDCLEFDDRLRYVDVIDDVAFLAMDLEFMDREDLAQLFLDEYLLRCAEPVPHSLTDFYIAYRAVVRAKVDCVRVEQGRGGAAADARKHIDIALKHLRAATVRLVIVSGGPGTGKTSLARALAEETGAQVISTDDVRKQLQNAGVIAGAAGALDEGLYSPANVAVVYDEVLRRAERMLRGGVAVVLDGTWRDPHQRARALRLGDRTHCPTVELTCVLPLVDATARVRERRSSTSDATPEIAEALIANSASSFEGHAIDTSRPLAHSVAEAQQICCLAV